MYSRFPDPKGKPERPIRVPDHYSGCAFSENRDRPVYPPPSAPPKIEKESPPPVRQIPPPVKISPNGDAGFGGGGTPLPKPPAPCRPTETSAPAEPLRRTPGGIVGIGGIGRAFPFTRGLDFDELLLLGLILLLSQSDPADQDLILFLTLLLFCG